MHGNAGAGESLLEQRSIVARRTQKNGDPVERHALLRLVAGQARNFDAFAALARRGQDVHVSPSRCGRCDALDEEVFLHARERTIRRVVERLHRHVERTGKVFDRPLVAPGRGCEHRARQSSDKPRLELGLERHIEQQGRSRQQRMSIALDGEPKNLRAVGKICAREVGFIRLEEPTQVAPGAGRGQTQFLKRARQRPCKPRLLPNRLEAPQLSLPAQLMHEPGADGLHSQWT